MVKSIHSPEYKELLKRLREARLKAGLTQVDVAAVLGVHQSFVSKIEIGERRVDVLELARFARLYSQTVDSLLVGLGE